MGDFRGSGSLIQKIELDALEFMEALFQPLKKWLGVRFAMLLAVSVTSGVPITIPAFAARGNARAAPARVASLENRDFWDGQISMFWVIMSSELTDIPKDTRSRRTYLFPYWMLTLGAAGMLVTRGVPADLADTRALRKVLHRRRR